ncbi:glycosyltransferase [Microbacterium sp. M4A5_1d]|uniref:glycosyltransferase n=1 Tax=Microbacterium sp. BDGP8 TaxID=3035531 RepID=UPI00249F2C00|nr:glycosyltransferase [Microbacterium sp. BDGP8]WHE36734.1 glycosyltransferase [Microbacterium sp. BDGP8]
MTGRIGWYVHHHGRGHLTRMLAIAPHLDVDVVCFSSMPAPAELPANVSWVELSRDDVPAPAVPADDPTAGGLLHWAPLHHVGHRSRFAVIAAAVGAGDIDAFVVDVSAEVTLFVRLLGVPVVIITQPGDRTDEPHRLAYAAARRVIAPWPEEIYAPEHLTSLGDRVAFVGGISRFAGRRRPAQPRGDEVVLLGGGGGADVSADDIAAAERASGRPWRVLGAGSGAWAADPWDALTTAAVVVSWCGQNAVADLAAAGAPAIVIPQERPFSEQRATALALGRSGLAVAVPRWPEPARWPDLLDQASACGEGWTAWRADGAAQRAAEIIRAEAAAGAGA